MIIDKCLNSDRRVLIDIWEAAVRATHEFLSETEIFFYKDKILNDYFDSVDLYKIRAITQNDDIVGFIGVAGVKLEMLFISPKFFRLGYGRLLLEFALENLGVTDVDVNEENNGAVAFYKKLGFMVVGRSEKDSEGKNHPIILIKIRKI